MFKKLLSSLNYSSSKNLVDTQVEIFDLICESTKLKFFYEFKNNDIEDELIFNDLIFINIKDRKTISISFESNTSQQFVSINIIKLLRHFIIIPTEDFTYNEKNGYIFENKNAFALMKSSVNELSNLKSIDIN